LSKYIGISSLGWHRNVRGAPGGNVRKYNSPLKAAYVCPINVQLECGPMPNLMVALPNTGGAFCSTPQFG